MTREWTVTRLPPNGQVVLGEFDLGGGLPCASLERLAVQIPEGRYRVELTVSTRATAGTLWCPYDDFKLPQLLDVPGRTGIRMHALSHILTLAVTQTDGCIGVGSDHTATDLDASRPALTRVVNDLRQYEVDGDDVWLTLRSAGNDSVHQ